MGRRASERRLRDGSELLGPTAPNLESIRFCIKLSPGFLMSFGKTHNAPSSLSNFDNLEYKIFG